MIEWIAEFFHFLAVSINDKITCVDLILFTAIMRVWDGLGK